MTTIHLNTSNLGQYGYKLGDNGLPDLSDFSLSDAYRYSFLDFRDQKIYVLKVIDGKLMWVFTGGHSRRKSEEEKKSSLKKKIKVKTEPSEILEDEDDVPPPPPRKVDHPRKRSVKRAKSKKKETDQKKSKETDQKESRQPRKKRISRKRKDHSSKRQDRQPRKKKTVDDMFETSDVFDQQKEKEKELKIKERESSLRQNPDEPEGLERAKFDYNTILQVVADVRGEEQEQEAKPGFFNNFMSGIFGRRPSTTSSSTDSSSRYQRAEELARDSEKRRQEREERLRIAEEQRRAEREERMRRRQVALRTADDISGEASLEEEDVLLASPPMNHLCPPSRPNYCYKYGSRGNDYYCCVHPNCQRCEKNHQTRQYDSPRTPLISDTTSQKRSTTSRSTTPRSTTPRSTTKYDSPRSPLISDTMSQRSTTGSTTKSIDTVRYPVYLDSRRTTEGSSDTPLEDSVRAQDSEGITNDNLISRTTISEDATERSLTLTRQSMTDFRQTMDHEKAIIQTFTPAVLGCLARRQSRFSYKKMNDLHSNLSFNYDLVIGGGKANNFHYPNITKSLDFDVKMVVPENHYTDKRYHYVQPNIQDQAFAMIREHHIEDMNLIANNARMKLSHVLSDCLETERRYFESNNLYPAGFSNVTVVPTVFDKNTMKHKPAVFAQRYVYTNSSRLPKSEVVIFTRKNGMVTPLTPNKMIAIKIFYTFNGTRHDTTLLDLGLFARIPNTRQNNKTPLGSSFQNILYELFLDPKFNLGPSTGKFIPSRYPPLPYVSHKTSVGTIKYVNIQRSVLNNFMMMLINVDIMLSTKSNDDTLISKYQRRMIDLCNAVAKDQPRYQKAVDNIKNHAERALHEYRGDGNLNGIAELNMKCRYNVIYDSQGQPDGGYFLFEPEDKPECQNYSRIINDSNFKKEFDIVLSNIRKLPWESSKPGVPRAELHNSNIKQSGGGSRIKIGSFRYK